MMCSVSGSRRALERGAAFMAGSALLFGGMSVAVKLAALTLPNSMVVFFRSAVALVLLLPWLLKHGRAALRTERAFEHGVRGLGGVTSMYCGFYAIGHMRLADAVLLNYSLPLLLPLVERVWLKEPVARRLWLPLAMGFGGLLLILRPGSGMFQSVALVGLASAVFGAIAQVGVRGMARTEPVTRIVFYFALIATSVSSVPLIFTWRTPTPSAWIALISAGVLATGAQFLLTRAYACAPAQQVAPFMYLTVVFSGLFDWLLWRVVPDGLFVVGALVVASAAILTLRLRSRVAPESD
jgi:drug/metabolite transporter (DMT)-like permease